jgi:hypothetical protein
MSKPRKSSYEFRLLLFGVFGINLCACVTAEWPCCDDCSFCNKKMPPECACSDVSTSGCHPACKKCEKTTGNDGKPVYQCKDVITNFCVRRCTPAAEQDI